MGPVGNATTFRVGSRGSLRLRTRPPPEALAADQSMKMRARDSTSADAPAPAPGIAARAQAGKAFASAAADTDFTKARRSMRAASARHAGEPEIDLGLASRDDVRERATRAGGHGPSER